MLFGLLLLSGVLKKGRIDQATLPFLKTRFSYFFFAAAFFGAAFFAGAFFAGAAFFVVAIVFPFPINNIGFWWFSSGWPEV